jgi:methylenetetrahydrofolate--tRNA-(uracil-5-)-methyltransferase
MTRGELNVSVIGGGLAGSEAAWQLANGGIHVNLYEMRPQIQTEAHETGNLAELICSNSLGSNLSNRASGLLKEEMRRLGSLIVACADATALPAGGALAVDRAGFSELVTRRLEDHPNIRLIRQEVKTVPAGPAVIATGPLTSQTFATSLSALTGSDFLYFFDAIAPIVTLESIDLTQAFRASRYDWQSESQGDYINCPFTKEQYDAFVYELVHAQRIYLADFEQPAQAGVQAGHARFFEGCLPIEVLAARGPEALSFGPMRPVGLRDHHTGKRPHAILQLRQDNLANTLYNLVGFQTNLTFPEQKRVFRMILGLHQAEFMPYGQMHRNTFIFSPALLHATLQFKGREDLFFAGQIVGVEGYIGNAASGLVAGLNLARYILGEDLLEFPVSTMIGALLYYISHATADDFQPMKANFGILPPLTVAPKGKQQRGAAYAERALGDLAWFCQSEGIKGVNAHE